MGRYKYPHLLEMAWLCGLSVVVLVNFYEVRQGCGSGIARGEYRTGVRVSRETSPPMPSNIG